LFFLRSALVSFPTTELRSTFILLGGYPPFQAKDEDDRDALFAIIKKV
jgi:hypothetical protein